jgi:hypothetical protein
MSFAVKFISNNTKCNKIKPKKILPESAYPNEKFTLGTIIPMNKLPLHVYIGLQFTKRDITSYVNLINAHVGQFQYLVLKNYYKSNTLNIYNNILEKQKNIQFIVKTVVSLRRFVQLWLYKKYRARQLNTEDPATMCIPTKPIHIFDARAKGVYSFEMSTIKKQFTTDLSYSDWLFPHVRQPKNPFTNLPFTESQLIYIINVLKNNSMTNSYIEAYRETKFNEKKYQEEYYIPLRLRALDDIIVNTSSDQFTELLFEFIEDQYDYHECPIKSYLNIINWAIHRKPSDLYIKKWIDIFYNFMRIEIINGKDYLDDNYELADKYYTTTKTLLYDTKELARLGHMRLQSIPKRPSQVTILPVEV